MRKIRMGMVGGGEGAFIGAIHRIAAALDGEIELVCGAFSSDPRTSVISGRALNIDESRCYSTYQEMILKEASLCRNQKMDFVAIVTPNHLHFDVAKMAIESGFHVLCDKPATLSLQQAEQLCKLLESSDSLYGLTHTYVGYPMIKEAKNRISTGELGKVVKVVVEYHQGWLAAGESKESKQASWRLDPEKAGISCCMGDIGVHAANLAEYVTGLEISHVCADLNSVIKGRELDDDGVVLLKFNNDAKGVLLASQICVGEENNLRLRVYGEQKSLEWSQLEPNTLWLKSNNQATQMLRSGVGQLSQPTIQSMRTPAGHPEGYLEAFANIYKNFARQIRAKLSEQNHSNEDFDVPGIAQALRGMAFIEQVVLSSKQNLQWQEIQVMANNKATNQ